MNLLFICSINKVRSRTAEVVFNNSSEHNAKSAGISANAVVPVSSELLNWAEIVFVMEDTHEEYLRINFADETRYKEIVNLEINDLYYFMQPELVSTIKEKVATYLKDF